MAFHSAFIVVPSVVGRLRYLVERALATGDPTDLRKFHAGRFTSNRRNDDEWAVELEPEPLATVVKAVVDAARSLPLTAETRRLLATLVETSLEPRQVSMVACDAVMSRAEDFVRLSRLEAEPKLLVHQLSKVCDAMVAIDNFDLLQRAAPAGSPIDEQLVLACLENAHVLEWGDVSGDDLGDTPLHEGPELFPQPTDPAELARWERFCGGFPTVHPPRIAWGDRVSALPERIEKARQKIPTLSMDAERRRRTDAWLATYASATSVASDRKLCVVEWVEADTN